MRESVLLLALVACGSNAREQVDASMPDAAADASTPADVPCTYVPATNGPAPMGITYTFSGGTFASYGCAPIDPTYWMSGAGMSATVTFATPMTNPAIRIWGMNSDDTASITVNGAAFQLTPTSAAAAQKVVCGLSPGPDGVAFVGGNLAGANTPGEGNYSYQDLTLFGPAIQSIKITGLTGAGWGFVGASVGCEDEPVLE